MSYIKNKLDILPFGAQYYRFPTPTLDCWESDLSNMAKHGFNTVKIWAVWRVNNPKEGVYDWSDIDKLMDLSDKFNLKVIINLIFDSAPAWFYKKYPESIMITNDEKHIYPTGNACRQMGGAPGPCFHHVEGQKIREEFTCEIVKRYANHKALLCWDLWNEPEHTVSLKRELVLENLTCYCQNSQQDFKKWLIKKYETINNLNTIWGRNYNDFDEVETPRLGDCFKDMIDWRMFMTDTITDEVRLRINAARKEDSVHPMMVHTVTIPFFPLATCGSDDYAIANECDIFGNSVGSEPLSAGITISAAPNKMVINSEIHAVGGTTYNRPFLNTLHEMKRHIFLPLSQGIKGFVFWQYRPERIGREAPAWGLTDLAGNMTTALDATMKINNALQKRANLILTSSIGTTDIGVINSQKSQLFDFCNRGKEMWYIKSVKGAHAMLRRVGYNVDLVGDLQITDEFLEKYKVLYDPFPYYKDAKSCEVLKRWIENGGVYISEGIFGGYSDDDGLHSITQPGFGFDEVFSAKEEKVTTASSFKNAYGENWSDKNDNNVLDITTEHGDCLGFHFYQSFTPVNAKSIGTYIDGSTAVTKNTFGKGIAIAIGSLLAYTYEQYNADKNADFISALIQSEAKLSPIFKAEKNVRADILSSEFGNLVIVDNQTDKNCVEITINSDSIRGETIVNIISNVSGTINKKGDACVINVPVEPFGIEVFEFL